MKDQGRSDRNVSTVEDLVSSSLVFRTFYGTKLITEQSQGLRIKIVSK